MPTFHRKRISRKAIEIFLKTNTQNKMSKGKTSYVNPDESIKKNIAMENTAKDLKFEDANFDSLKFENAETGQFEFAKMTEEGDTFTGFVLQDCEKDFPSWLP